MKNYPQKLHEENLINNRKNTLKVSRQEFTFEGIFYYKKGVFSCLSKINYSCLSIKVMIIDLSNKFTVIHNPEI